MLAPDTKFTVGLFSEHLASIGFLLDLRQSYFHAADVPWTKVAELEARIEAHRDALELGGQVATEHAVNLLESEDADELKGAVYYLAWSGPEGDAHKAMISAWLGAPEKRLPAFFAPLQFAAQMGRKSDVWPALTAANPPPLLVGALNVSRCLADIKADKCLPFCSRESPAVKRAAVEVCAVKGAKALLPALERAYLDDTKAVDSTAVFWLLVLGSVRALGVARDACRASETAASDWLACIAYAGSSGDLSLFSKALQNSESRVADIRACGVFGHVALVPQLMAMLAAKDEAQKVAAAVALETMTGAGLTENVVQRLTTELAPADVVQSPGVNAGTFAGSAESDDLIEITRVSTVHADWAGWWNANSVRFNACERWRKGQPANLGVLIEQLADPSSSYGLRSVNQLELRIRSGQAIDCACDGPVTAQLAAIQLWRQWWEANKAQYANNYWLFAGRG